MNQHMHYQSPDKRTQSSMQTGLVVQRTCACGRHTVAGGECAECRQKRLVLQRRATKQAKPATAPPIVHDVLQQPGRPLDGTTRRDMESRFGCDFSHVRVHTDTAAAVSAQAVNARAYTVGSNVVFGNREYAPHAREGRRLLAHELTHVIQQQNASVSLNGHSQAAHEREADAAAETIQQNGTFVVQRQVRTGVLQRAAPAAAAAPGIGALAAKCIVGAIVGVLIDLGLQALLHSWREWTWRFWEVTVDVCALVLSAILGCIGGVVAARWLEPWIDSALGTRLGGVAGPLIGKVLIFIAKKIGLSIPKGALKALLKFGCVSEEQAEVIDPGISREESASSDAGTPPAETETAVA